VSTWEAGGVRYREVVAAARDGLTFWTLRAWIPDDGSQRPRAELDALVNGLALAGAAEKTLRAAIEQVQPQLPHLTAAAVELTMLQSPDLQFDGPGAFRQAQVLASRGLAALTHDETRELDALNAAIAAGLTRPERRQLATFQERVRRGDLAAAADAGAAMTLVRGAVLRLDRAQIARVQAINEKAIRAAVGAGR
jgi:hypothetical protein